MIVNGKDSQVSESPDLPDVAEGVQRLLQSLKFGIVQKQQIGGYTQETLIYQTYKASIQPMNRALAIKKEGERSWKWYTIYATPELVLRTDDVIVYGGTRFRIMSDTNWSSFGYVEYSAIEDYQKGYQQ